MKHLIGGYKPSSGTLNVPAFVASNTLQQLAAVNTSSTYIIPDTLVPIDDQGQLNSCVANSSTTAFEILLSLSNPSAVKMLSRLFVYWNARMYTGDTSKDQGTFIHNAMDSMTRLGVCEESIWQYDPAMVFTQPPILAYKEGNDNTINSFYQIVSEDGQRCSDIELAIRANHPVVFGTNVGAEFEAYTGNGPAFNAPTTSLGGHALLVVGVRNTAPNLEFCIRNSWGPNWGDAGHCWFSSAYMSDSATNDLFVATTMPNLMV